MNWQTPLLPYTIQVRILAEYFDKAFGTKSIPDNIPELKIDKDNDKLVDIISILVGKSFVQSTSEFRRMLKQNGVQINGEKINDLDYMIKDGDVIKIGKKTFIRFKIQ